MMRLTSSCRLTLFLACSLLFFRCSTNTDQNGDISAATDSTGVPLDYEFIGVKGDFDGDSVVDSVMIKILNDANSNPDEGFNYSIEFSNPKLTPITISPMIDGGYVIVNEGNIDGKPGDELSIVVCDVNKTAILSLYTFDGKDWYQIAESVNVVCNLPDSIDWNDVLVDTDSGVFVKEFELFSYDSITFKKKPVILSSVRGDFDGNGESENVYVKQLHGAPVDDEGYWEYEIVFSDTKLPTLKIENLAAEGCRVSNNGNTDEKKGDELSVTTNEMMGQIIDEVFGYDGKKWKSLSLSVSRNPMTAPLDDDK